MKQSNYYNTVMSCYSDYAKHKNSTIRKNFLYNLPAIVMLSDQKSFENNYLSKYINLTMNDSNLDVQVTGAAILHEISNLIGVEDSHRLLNNLVNFLFMSDEIEILTKIIKYYEQILTNFSKDLEAKSIDINIIVYFTF